MHGLFTADCSYTGSPIVAPERLLKALLLVYVYSIRSEDRGADGWSWLPVTAVEIFNSHQDQAAVSDREPAMGFGIARHYRVERTRYGLPCSRA